MDDYRIEICTVNANGRETPAPYELRIDQRRLGPVELRLGALSGSHALHFAVAMCVFNNIGREAHNKGIRLSHVSVSADGGFDEADRSTGISFWIDVEGDAPEEKLKALAALAADSWVAAQLSRPTPVTFAGTKVTSTVTA